MPYSFKDGTQAQSFIVLGPSLPYPGRQITIPLEPRSCVMAIVLFLLRNGETRKSDRDQLKLAPFVERGLSIRRSRSPSNEVPSD